MTGTDLMTKRVLAIDDDETILNVMDNLLKMHDYEAVTATQWVEALDAINERSPDLLLLDLQMPHVDGFFLLEWIREQELVLPVIVVSAYLDEESMGRLESLGVSAFVWKPFNVSDLIEQIESLIGKAAVADPVESTEDIEITPPSNAAIISRQDGPAEVGVLQDSVPAEPVDSSESESELESEDEDEGEGTLRIKRRTRRSRRGTSKRRRRRTALYLLLIAVISVGISSFSIYLRNVAESVEKAVEEEMSTRDDDNKLLKELLRTQIETDRISKVNVPKRALDLNLPRKQKK